jgi:L-serine dehydratase
MSQDYNNIAQLLEAADSRGLTLWQVILAHECELDECDEESVFKRLEKRYEIMRNSSEKALHRGLKTQGNLISGIAAAQFSFAANRNSLSGSFINTLMARALSCSETNASMGKICAAPTAGSCGIVPAVIISVAEQRSLDKRSALEGLLTAAGIGAVITKNATVSGAEGGCQAECGVAAAMAAAAAVQMAGGSNKAQVDASALALINCMGLICDPIAGLVQVPCAQRNASQAVNALTSADMALAGMQSPIPCDEVIEAMYRCGRLLPQSLKETAQGGIAAEPAAQTIALDIKA